MQFLHQMLNETSLLLLDDALNPATKCRIVWLLQNTRECSNTPEVWWDFTVLLQIFSWFWQHKNSKNWSIFDEVKAYKNGANFLAPLYSHCETKFC